MSKKKTTTPEVAVVAAVANVEANVAKALGRPSNPSSVRQKRIAELETKRVNGECKRGRPTVASSKRQATLAARAEKSANGTLSARFACELTVTSVNCKAGSYIEFEEI